MWETDLHFFMLPSFLAYFYLSKLACLIGSVVVHHHVEKKINQFHKVHVGQVKLTCVCSMSKDD